MCLALLTSYCMNILTIICISDSRVSSHMGQYQLLSVLAARLFPLNIDQSRDLPVEISDINYTEKYTNL